MNLIYIPLCITIFFFNSTNANQSVTPYFCVRSQEKNTARDFAGWTDYINLPCDKNKVYGVFSITPEYTQSFRPDHITVPLFGNILQNNNKSTLTVSGTQTDNRSAQDLLADYFYLPPDFKSSIELKPTIDNFLVSFGWYLGLDPWSSGLYLWLQAPLVHTRWNLHITEHVEDPGIQPYAPGYFTPSAVPRSNLLEQFTDYSQGTAVSPNIDSIVFEELKFAKMSTHRLIKTRFAEFRLRFGKNFLVEEDYNFGVNLQVAAPAGLKPQGNFLFEPMIGNGHHWELGFETNGHYIFWHNEENLQWALFYANINLTHLFKSHQKRVFDLIHNGPLSRYMLALEMQSPATNLLGGGVTPTNQFGNKILPVANITALDVNVSVAIQADILFMFTFISEGFSLDVGYNYWGRSKEIIKLKNTETFEQNKYALKGDAQIFGFIQNSNNSVALSATESKATIHTGTNFPATGSTNNTVITTAQKNSNIDFPQPATTTAPTQLLQFQPNNVIPADQINTSVNPIMLSTADVNIKNSGTTGMSNKIFAHFAYTWIEKDGWVPYIGIGGEIEFDMNNTNIKKIDTHTIRTGDSHWALWLKGGVTFY